MEDGIEKNDEVSPRSASALKVAALLIGGAAAGLWVAGFDEAAFVSAVAGSVSFFLGVRAEVKHRREREGGYGDRSR